MESDHLNIFHGDYILLKYENLGIEGYLGNIDQFFVSMEQAIMNRQAILHQVKENKNYFNNCTFQILLEDEDAPINTPIKFGNVVRFKHVLSQSYLTASSEFSTGSHYFLVSIKKQKMKSQCFIIHSQFKTRVETENVISSDSICIQSFVTDLHIGLQKQEDKIVEEQHQRIYKIITKNKKENWKIIFSSRPTKEKIYFNGGDFITLNHIEIEANIQVRWDDFEFRYKQNALDNIFQKFQTNLIKQQKVILKENGEQKAEAYSIQSLFQIEKQKQKNSTEIQYGEIIRFRH